MTLKINSQREHYIKYSLMIGNNISMKLKYYFLCQNKPEQNNKYILESEVLNLSVIVNDTTAEGLIEQHCYEEEEIVSFEDEFKKETVISVASTMFQKLQLEEQEKNSISQKLKLEEQERRESLIDHLKEINGQIDSNKHVDIISIVGEEKEIVNEEEDTALEVEKINKEINKCFYEHLEIDLEEQKDLDELIIDIVDCR